MVVRRANDMNRSRLILAMVVLPVVGCGGGKMVFLTAPEPPVVWPKPPDRPRVRYIGELKSSEDIGQQKSFGEVWDELLFGPKPPSRLVSPQAVAVNATGEKVAVADVNGKCVHLFDLNARTYAALVRVGSMGGEPAVRDGAPRNEAVSRPADEPRMSANTLESPIAVCWAGERLWVADSRQQALALPG